MSCPFCSEKNGKAYCDLSKKDVDYDTQKEYCSPTDQSYEKCSTYEKAEVLTENTCNEILRCFSEAVHNTQEGFCAFAEIVTELARDCDYLPLHDACRILEDPPQIPKCGNTYTGMVSTDQERELAEQLDEELENLLESLEMSIRYGSGGGEYPCVSPNQIADAAHKADYYGSLAAECMENLRISVKPDKFADPAQGLAAKSGEALRRRFLEVVEALGQAEMRLSEGMHRTEAAADNAAGWVLRDAGIRWEVD